MQIERESTALLAELEQWPQRVTSIVGEIELRRAGRRAGIEAAQIAVVLDRFGLIALDDPVRELAAQTGTPQLRTLDAVHLATALSLGDELGGFACYDERLASDARAAGLPIVAPS